jgi:heptosyltransferase-2
MADEPYKILIRMPNWIGDFVMATPLLSDLRKHFQDAKITAMCQSQVATLLTSDPDVDEVLSFKKISGWIHGQHHDIVDPIRFGKFDLGILATNSFSSAWWFYRGNVIKRIGFAKHFRSLLLTQAIPYPQDAENEHQVLTYKRLLVPIGIPLSSTKPRLYIGDQEKVDAIERLRQYGILYGKHLIVGINPGAAYGTAKCWLPERFNEVTWKLLQDPEVRILYFGDNSTVSLIQNICKDMPERVVNLAGKTSLRELIALISLASAILTNDSGPMHIASALHIPVIALFGSTNSVKTGPYSSKGKVIHKQVSCSPCYRRVCPIDFRCMKEIGVEEVYQALKKSLSSEEVQRNKR